MAERKFFIPPSIERSSDIDTGDNSSIFGRRERKFISDFIQITEFEFSVIISKPGFGKSRLLKEIVLRSAQLNKEALYINLKRISDQSYEENIKSILLGDPKCPFSNSEINSIYDSLFTESFHLENNSEIIICFDALDEVPQQLIENHIVRLFQFKKAYPQVKIVLSCRDYIFTRYQNYFAPYNPTYLSIQPFNIVLIGKYLQKCDFKKEEIETITERFSQGFFQVGVIDSPRVLEAFVEIKEKEGLESVISKSRSELLEHFINNLLLVEDTKYNKNEKELKRRLLDILSLTIQIYQKQVLTKDEFITFLGDVNTHLSSAILSTIKLDDFFDHSLFIPELNSVMFQNAEFQEYMAALEITRLPKTNQIVFDLVFDSEINEFYPSWTNTLKYIVDLLPDLLFDLIDFITKRDSSADKTILENVLLDNSRKIESLEPSKRFQVFKKIFESFQVHKWYIYDPLVDKLALYWSNEYEVSLINYIKSKDNDNGQYVGRLNAVNLLEELLSKNKIAGSGEIKEILKKIITTDSINSIRERAVSAISKFKDWNLLKDLHGLVSPNSNLHRAFIKGFESIDPNNPYTIDLIAESIKNGGDRVLPNDDFDAVTSESGLSYLVKKFTDDEELRNSYGHFQPSYQMELVEKNLNAIWAPTLSGYIKKFVKQMDSIRLERSGIDGLLVSVWSKNDPNAIDEVINWFKNDPEVKLGKTSYYYYLFQALLTVENSERFIYSMKQIPGTDWIVRIFWGFRYEKEESKSKMFEISKKFFLAEYEKAEQSAISYDSNSENYKRYLEFRQKLEPKPNHYSTDVFQVYKSWKDILSPFLKSDDMLRMKQLLSDTIIKHFDFNKATVTIETNGQSRTFHTSTMVPIYSDALPLFEEFGIPQESYRLQMVQFIPFCFNDQLRKKIFNMLGTLKEDEINWLVRFYSEPRKDDAKVANVESLFDSIQKFNISEGYVLLRNIVFDREYEPHQRFRAFSILSEKQIDSEFNYGVFQTYVDSTEETERNIGIKANELLIINSSSFQRSSIEWRMNQIISKPIEYFPDDKHGFLNPHEIEFRTHSFNAPLSHVTDDQFQEQYQNFLKRAIKLYKRYKKFRSYAVYIWDTVANYFEQLRIKKSLEPLHNLEKTISQTFPFSGYPYLELRLQRVKQTYLKDFRKPESFVSCVQTYNKLKEKSYLSISSIKDFEMLIKEILERDIKAWIEEEGAYKLIDKLKQQEDIIQKTLKSEFEKGLLKRGIRFTDIIREPQLLDNRKPDYIVSYGFIGKILVELKLTKNIQVRGKKEREKYKSALLKYMEGFHIGQCFYLLFQVDASNKLETILPKVQAVFGDCPHVQVFSYNCLAT